MVVYNSPEDATGYGPIFEEEPVDVVYTEDSPDGRISMNCRTRANPPATYRLHTQEDFPLKQYYTVYISILYEIVPV